MEKYHKISGPFKRHTEGPLKNQIIPGGWQEVEFEALQGMPWCWSEKIDGTNVRVEWDGHQWMMGGRTDKAQLPKPLVERMDELFTEELLEQTFKGQPVMLYGEGYGAKIQKGGGDYIPDGVDFVLFDVRINDSWLTPWNVDNIAISLGLTSIYQGSPPQLATLNEAIEIVSGGMVSGFKQRTPGNEAGFGYGWAEGLVGCPVGGLLNRKGERIIVKVKHCDFFKE